MGITMINDTEKQIENAIFKYLSLEPGIFAFKVETKGVFNQATNAFRHAGQHVVLGTADILACYDCGGIGIFIALEVKSAIGKISQNQINFKQRVEAVNGFYFLVRSIQDTQKALETVRTTLAEKKVI